MTNSSFQNSDFFQPPFWWKKIWNDSLFATKVNLRWTELKTTILNSQNIHQEIDSISNVLDESRIRNFQRWPVLGSYVWPNYFIGQSYLEEKNYLKDWINGRLHWMNNNMIGVVTNVDNSRNTYVSEFTLDQNYPNPFNPSTKIEYSVLRKSFITIKVYNVLGNEIAVLVIEEKPRGKYNVEFNINSVNGRLSTGVYFYRLRAHSPNSTKDYVITKKMILLK